MTVARKPLLKTVAATIMAHGTGALNIDATRIEADGGSPSAQMRKTRKIPIYVSPMWNPITSRKTYNEPRPGEEFGRWPANLILTSALAAHLDETLGSRKVPAPLVKTTTTLSVVAYNGIGQPAGETVKGYGDDGGVSRFFKVLDED